MRQSARQPRVLSVRNLTRGRHKLLSREKTLRFKISAHLLQRPPFWNRETLLYDFALPIFISTSTQRLVRRRLVISCLKPSLAVLKSQPAAPHFPCRARS